jgi:hypothetical protein
MSDSAEMLDYDIPNIPQKKKPSNLDGLITLVPIPEAIISGQQKTVFLRYYGAKVPLPSAVLLDVLVSPDHEGHSFERWRSNYLRAPLSAFQGNLLDWEANSNDYDDKLGEIPTLERYSFPNPQNAAASEMQVLVSDLWFRSFGKSKFYLAKFGRDRQLYESIPGSHR